MIVNYVAIATNLITSGFGVALGLIMMIIGYKIFDKITPFNTDSELDDGNLAIGLVVSSIFIGVALMTGTIIGSVLG